MKNIEGESRRTTRRDFIQVAGLGMFSLYLPKDGILNESVTKENWPSLNPKELPEEMNRFKRIYGMIPQREINDQGWLALSNSSEIVDVLDSETNETETREENELKKEIGGLPITWLVILQKVSEKPSGILENYANTSHFLIEEKNITQTKSPTKNGKPQMAKGIRYSDPNKINSYAAAMKELSLETEYRGKFDPPLAKMFFKELNINTSRRAMVVKIKGEIGDKTIDPSNQLMANLLSVLRSLKKYDLNSWNMVDNTEMYGNVRDMGQDIGVKTMAEVRHYLGILTLIDGDEKEKQLTFGNFERGGERKLEGVKRYFRANRDYLKKVFVARDLQSWDAKTKYWFWVEKLSGEKKMPIADNFMMPIENDSGGGSRFLENVYDLDDPKEKTGTYHLGYDFNIGSGNEDEGMPFKCIGNGRVVWVGWSTNGMGKMIIVRHRLKDGSEFYSRYGHVQDQFISRGEDVSIDQEIGTIGKTGRGDHPNFYAHLHLDIAYAKTYEKWMKDNPQYYENKSKKQVEEQFVDPIIFIEEHSKSLETVKQDNKNPTLEVGTFPE